MDLAYISLTHFLNNPTIDSDLIHLIMNKSSLTLVNTYLAGFDDYHRIK